jgi:hypothetical protein
MYHPLEDEHEFIELFNTGDTNVSLFDSAGTGAGWRVSDDTGVAFTFPSNTTIRADSYVVVVGEGTDCDTFRHGYDIPPDVPVLGPCSRNFGNHSDAVILSRPVVSPTGGPPVYVRVETVGYYDDAPWPCAADGKGPSLERIDPAAIGNEPDNWYAQTVGGTPGGVPEPGVAAVILLLIAGRLVRYSHITQEMR